MTHSTHSTQKQMVHIFIAPGFEEIEAITVGDILRRCNISVQFISMVSARQVTGANGITISCDNLFRRSELEGSECLVLPGGKTCAEYLQRYEGLRKLLVKHFGYKGLTAAICASPSVLGAHGFLQGRRATCYPGFEDTLRGAKFVNESVVEDENIITGRGPASAVDFAFAIASRLVPADVVRRVREGMLFF